jgi:hypothetical protein
VLLPNTSYNGSQGYGLFLTEKQTTLFDLKGENFIYLTNSESMVGFEAAYPIEANYFAAALGKEGVKIFSINFEGNELKLETQFKASDLGLSQIDVQDLAYDASRKILFILDHRTGVIPLQLTISTTGLQARRTSSTIKNSQCNVIYYDAYADELYLNCRELHKYRIGRWPIFDESVLPRQEISVKEITSSQSTVALVGRDIFEVISLERKAAIYEDSLLNKLILKDNYFISGSENEFITGSYTIVPPELTCSAVDDTEVGKHHVLFKVTAECKADYFDSIGFNAGNLDKNDRCVYTVYHKLKIWKPAALNVKAFGIIGMIIGLIGIGILIWWCCSYLDLRRLRTNLQQYQSLNEGNGGSSANENEDRPDQMVVEMNPVSGNSEGKEGRQELNEEVDLPHDLHDIE